MLRSLTTILIWLGVLSAGAWGQTALYSQPPLLRSPQAAPDTSSTSGQQKVVLQEQAALAEQKNQKNETASEDLKRREAELMKEQDDAAFRARVTLRGEQDVRFVEVNSPGGMPLGSNDLLNDRYFAKGIRIWGMDFLPSISVGETYNDNVYLRSGKPNFDRQSDFITTIQPMLTLMRGNPSLDNFFISGTYAPSALFFAEQTDENTVNHQFSGEVGVRLPKTHIYARQSVESVLGGDVESGDLMNRFVSSTDLSVEYELTPKLSAELAGKIIDRSYDRGVDALEGAVAGWLNYELTPKIIVGISPGVGWVDVSAGPDQRYLQGLTRVVYLAAEKLNFFAQGGAEVREFDGSSDQDLNGIFRGGGEWRPTEKSLVRLEASRYVQASNSFSGANVTGTGFTFVGVHRLIDQLSVNFNTGFQNALYSGTATGIVTDREDNYYFVGPGLAIAVQPWWDVNVGYVYRQNLSSASGNEFYNHLVNISSTLRF